MSQQIIDISTPDDGLGDVLRTGFNKTNQNFTELYNGKVDKVTGKGLSKNDFTDADKTKLDGIEAGAQVNVQSDWGETDPLAKSFILNKPPSLYSAFGYFHISDLATQTTPLAFLAATPLQLTNDKAGAFTNYEQAPYGVSDIWNTSTNKFEFAKLSVGDGVLFRADLSISTTSVNQNLQLYIKFGIGTPSEYDLLIDSWNEKSVITFKHFLKDVSFSIDNEDWRNAPAEIYILSDDDGSVKVNGWYIPIIRKSVNVIDFNSDPLKLDKDTTAGVERAYIINADGSQGTKATSEFKDVLEFADFDAFPTTGETGKFYLALDTNKTYRWSGSAYVQIGGSTEVDIFNPYNGNYRVGFQLFRRGLTTSTLSGVSDALVFTGGGALSAANFGSSFVKVTSPSTAGAKLELNGSTLFRAISNKFIYHFDFVVDDAVIVNSARMFVGLNNSFGTLGNVNPSTMTNCLGVGCDASETTLSIIHNDGLGTATKFNLGADFPSNSKTSYYRFKIYFNTTNSQSTIKCKLERYNLSFNLLFETEHIITTDILVTGFLYPMYWRNNESTASAVSLLIGKTLIAENV